MRGSLEASDDKSGRTENDIVCRSPYANILAAELARSVGHFAPSRERSAAEIAVDWPGDRGVDMLRCGLLYQCYCINEV